jgi:MHS family proline/betaine transporter-like MFS transporter
MKMKKVVVSGMIGNALEWYDYALYGHFAAIISVLYFPSESVYISMISTFGVFAAGFLMRPVGAIFFGFIGDRYGRKAALSLAILMMAIPTGCIGILPTYAQIGIWAPILLTIIRLLQGLSLGGEFSGAITFVAEHAPANKRGFAACSAIFSAAVGTLMGSLVAAGLSQMMSPEFFAVWGWRIPFVVGLMIGLVGMYIRTQLDESPHYEEAKAKGKLSKTPLRTAFKQYPVEMLQAVGIYLTVTVPFYVLVVFFNSFTSKILGYSVSDSLLMNSSAMLMLMATIPFSGYYCDKVGRKPILIAGAIGFAVFSYPIFLFLTTGGFWGALFAQVAFALLVGIFTGPIPAVLVEMFPTSIRYTGMSLAYNVSATVFGGTAPIVSTWLVKETGNKAIVAFYIMLCAVITLFRLYFFKDRYKAKLR